MSEYAGMGLPATQVMYPLWMLAHGRALEGCTLGSWKESEERKQKRIQDFRKHGM